MNDESISELLDLANAYIERRLDEGQKGRLETWLKADPEARTIFRNFLEAQSRFGLALTELSPVSDSDAPRSSLPGTSRHLAWAMAIAGLLGCLFLLSHFLKQTTPGSVAQGHVASVYEIDGEASVGGNTHSTLRLGDQLQTGDLLCMEEGVIELVFQGSGVHATASAPLSMELVSQLHMRLHDGEVRLHVPPQGIGFVVEAEGRRITDLGTEFVVKARTEGSDVLVLDGQITVSASLGKADRLLGEGGFSDLRSGETIHIPKHMLASLPELSVPESDIEGALHGSFFTFGDATPDRTPDEVGIDMIGGRFVPLVQSGFANRGSLAALDEHAPHSFSAIAGAAIEFPKSHGIPTQGRSKGWMVWYRGMVGAPAPGRYRFWGYADNHLLVSVDGSPVLDGSRFGSSLRAQLTVPRRDHPAWPCLNSRSGFVAGAWFEVGEDGVSLDILFGEQGGPNTAGMLLIEREGERYESTLWGQPRWPLFLVGQPSSQRVSEFESLAAHLERSLIGSFSVRPDLVWKLLP